MMKYCKNCGNEISEEEKFCNKCGAEITNNNKQEDAEENSSVESVTKSENVSEENSNVQNVTTNEKVLEKNGWNTIAIASFVCSIVGLFILGWLEILAIGFAIAAFNQIKNNQNQKGKGLAIAGLIIGIIGTLLWILGIVLTAVSATL